MEESARFGDLLKRYRLYAGLTQEELAEQALLSPRGIQDLERGVNRRPRRDTVERLVEALKLDGDDRTRLQATARVPLLSVNVRDSRTSHGPDHPLPVGGYLGAAPLTPLVERQPELACSLLALEAAVAGKGRLLVLAGEPGVGKTRLAQEVMVHARDRGCMVATGSCYESRKAVSYYPFLDALAGLYASSPSIISRTIPERWPYLGRLLPDAGLPQPGTLFDMHEEQERLFRAITGFIIAVSEAVPVVVLLDDLHWADEASLYLLQHLARQTRGRRVFILGTYRDVEVSRGHMLERTLSDLHRDRLIERVGVGRLGKDGTAELIRASLSVPAVSHELADHIHRHTDGNPFFTQEVVQALVERGDLYQEDRQWKRRAVVEIEVPQSVRSAIGQRVLRLDEDAQELLYEASVLGQSFTFDDLHAMTRWSDARMEHGLQEALAAGLVLEGDGETYVFNHSLTQQVLYTELPSRKRRRLHLAAAEALATLPSRKQETRATELSWHFTEGGDVEKALPYDMLAGRAAERVFDFGEAERHYRAALELSQKLDDRCRKAEARERLGSVLTALVRYEQGLETLEQAAADYGFLTDTEAEARTVAAIGRIHCIRGSELLGIERVEPMIEALEDKGPSSSLARLYLARALLSQFLSRPAELFHYADRAIEVARTLDDRPLLTEATSLRGRALLNVRRLDEAASTLEQVVAMYEELGDPIGMCRALYNLGYVHDAWGQFSVARGYFERGLAVARRLAEPWRICEMLEALAWNALVTGQWDRMRNHMDQMAAISEPLHDPAMASSVLWLLIALSLQEGNFEAASERLQEVSALADKTGGAFIRKTSEFMRASLDLLEGHPELALPILRAQVEEREPEPDLTLLPVLAEAYLQTGDLVQAERVAVRARRRASSAGDRKTLTWALRVHGMLLTRHENWSEAACVFDEALALAKRIQTPWDEARIRYEYGKMHSAMGDQQHARERMGEALAIFRRLGARKETERTKQALAEVG